MRNVLIASLGESPIVVTAMYDLLTKRQRLAIDKVVVLQPKGELIPLAFDLIRESLRDRCEAIAEPLGFDDADDEANSFSFLHTLYRLLNDAQKSGDRVYLSLAGGRKNMSALMALLVPLFPCVKGLYHVIDQDEGKRSSHFKSINAIFDLPDEDARLSYFLLTNDELERLSLVDIPYGERQQVSEEYRQRLYTIKDMADLDDWWADTVDFLDFVEEEDANLGWTLEVLLTKHAAEQFEHMWKYDRTRAREFKFCLERLRFATIAKRDAHHIYTHKLRQGEHDIYSQNLAALTFHFFKIKRKRFTSTERPVFHTVPKDIKSASDKEVERVIISELEYKRGDDYRSLEEITGSRGFFPLGPFCRADDVLKRVKKATDGTPESVLIVPLGNRPMIATQLYTLLTSEGSDIREVVLVYPTKVKAGADLLEKAFKDEKKGVSCVQKAMVGYADIDSKDACQAFEQALEEAIDETRSRHPGCQIELALSGGRKGMAALAMFVAQREGIHYLYHTLIKDTDRRLLNRIEKETIVDALQSPTLSREIRNNRLFLRAYEGNGPYTKFLLFKVPVLPAGG